VMVGFERWSRIR